MQISKPFKAGKIYVARNARKHRHTQRYNLDLLHPLVSDMHRHIGGGRMRSYVTWFPDMLLANLAEQIILNGAIWEWRHLLDKHV